MITSIKLANFKIEQQEQTIAQQAAVIEQMEKQEPVGKVLAGGYEVELYKRMPEGAELYAAPVVQPDIDVLAEYTGQDGKREWKDVGAWLRPGDVIAVLAAAEGKP